jgi:hypothetical protein
MKSNKFFFFNVLLGGLWLGKSWVVVVVVVVALCFMIILSSQILSFIIVATRTAESAASYYWSTQYYKFLIVIGLIIYNCLILRAICLVFLSNPWFCLWDLSHSLLPFLLPFSCHWPRLDTTTTSLEEPFSFFFVFSESAQMATGVLECRVQNGYIFTLAVKLAGYHLLLGNVGECPWFWCCSEV